MGWELNRREWRSLIMIAVLLCAIVAVVAICRPSGKVVAITAERTMTADSVGSVPDCPPDKPAQMKSRKRGRGSRKESRKAAPVADRPSPLDRPVDGLNE